MTFDNGTSTLCMMKKVFVSRVVEWMRDRRVAQRLYPFLMFSINAIDNFHLYSLCRLTLLTRAIVMIHRTERTENEDAECIIRPVIELVRSLEKRSALFRRLVALLEQKFRL